MMDDLIEFLRAQLDDDERVARDVGVGWELRLPGAIVAGFGAGSGTAQQILRWDPARVLAEVDAKRRIIDEIEEHLDDANPIGGRGSMFLPRDWDRVLRLLALPYADREGYRSEWAP